MIVVAIVAIVGLTFALSMVVVLQARERLEWAEERRALIDRAIARHSGEVIAFDRARRARAEREPAPLLEGLT